MPQVKYITIMLEKSVNYIFIGTKLIKEKINYIEYT